MTSGSQLISTRVPDATRSNALPTETRFHIPRGQFQGLLVPCIVGHRIVPSDPATPGPRIAEPCQLSPEPFSRHGYRTPDHGLVTRRVGQKNPANQSSTVAAGWAFCREPRSCCRKYYDVYIAAWGYWPLEIRWIRAPHWASFSSIQSYPRSIW